MQLTCPIDHQVLIQQNNSLVCPNGHQYDLAKEGYVNLLPVQYKRSKNPGDNKQMVQARRRFLQTDLYLPIAEHINQTIDSVLQHDDIQLLDAGCGEGYYLANLLKSTDKTIVGSGLDISKFAIAAAAKAYKSAQWLVASNKQIPCFDHSLNAILCAFGFPVYSEFAKKLKRDGYLLLVEVGPKHLMEIRQLIYPELKPFRPIDTTPAQAAGFTLTKQTKLEYQIEINQGVMPDLMAMTPHLYRAPKTGLDQLFALEALSVTVDIDFYLLQLSDAD